MFRFAGIAPRLEARQLLHRQAERIEAKIGGGDAALLPDARQVRSMVDFGSTERHCEARGREERRLYLDGALAGFEQA